MQQNNLTTQKISGVDIREVCYGQMEIVPQEWTSISKRSIAKSLVLSRKEEKHVLRGTGLQYN